jgi:type I restriction enzyme S subunit
MTVCLAPYPAYKASGVDWLGEIPEHWQELRAKYLYREIDERSESGDEELLSVSHLTGVTPRSEKNITMFQAESYDGHKLCQPGDLVINTMWAWMAALGVSRQEGIVSPSYSIYRPLAAERIVPEYADLLLRTWPYKAQYHSRSTGIRSSRLRLYPDKFLEIPILCPPIEEQKSMLRFLSEKNVEITRLIRAKRRLIDLLTEQKQAIIQQAVTRGLDPNVRLKDSGVPWLGEVPEHWEVVPVKRALTELIDTEHKTAPAVDGGRYMVVRTSNIRHGRLVPDGAYYTDEAGFQEWTKRGVPEPGDILFTREAPAGEACLVPDGIDLCMGQRVVLMRADRKLIDPRYLMLLIQFGAIRKFITLNSQGSTVPHFNMSEIAIMPVLMPPLKQQRQILTATDAHIHGLDIAIERTESGIDLLREYRRRLISDVVTGKLDVRGVELPAMDEPMPLYELEADGEMDDEEMLAAAEEEAVYAID